jgi:UPF0176 protein
MQFAEVTMNKFVVSALYHFVHLDQPESLREPLLAFLEAHQIRGTLILATEGINGTVSGARASIDALYAWFQAQPAFADIRTKESFHQEQPFYRTKVKIKNEIVTMGVDNIDPQKIAGTYVQAKDWNALIADPEVLVVDTRNDYEYQIGSFDGAVNPKTDSFREFPAYVKQELDPAKHKKVAMFCTGGIRCEKSTAYLKAQGFDEVYHLQGGILKYLEEVDVQESLWAGQCFVFDNRVSVGHGLEVGDFELCYACRKPLSSQERQHAHYQNGLSCHHCYGSVSAQQKERFAERQRQMQLSESRGEHHIGSDARDNIGARRRDKNSFRADQRRLDLARNKAQEKPDSSQ